MNNHELQLFAKGKNSGMQYRKDVDSSKLKKLALEFEKMNQSGRSSKSNTTGSISKNREKYFYQIFKLSKEAQVFTYNKD